MVEVRPWTQPSCRKSPNIFEILELFHPKTEYKEDGKVAKWYVEKPIAQKLILCTRHEPDLQKIQVLISAFS